MTTIADIQLPRLASTKTFVTGDTLHIRINFITDGGSPTQVYVTDTSLTLEFETLCNGQSNGTLTATLDPPAASNDPAYRGPVSQLTFVFAVTETNLADQIRVVKINDPGTAKYAKIVDSGKQANVRVFSAKTLDVIINGGCNSSSSSLFNSSSSANSADSAGRSSSSSSGSGQNLLSSSSRRSSSSSSSSSSLSSPSSSSSSSSRSNSSSSLFNPSNSSASSARCCGCQLPANWAYGENDGVSLPRCLTIIPEAEAYDLICVPWLEPLTQTDCEQSGIFSVYYPSATDCTLPGGHCFPELTKTQCDKFKGIYNNCSSSSSSSLFFSSSSSSSRRLSSSSSKRPSSSSSSQYKSSSSSRVLSSSSSSSRGVRSNSSSSSSTRPSSSSSSSSTLVSSSSSSSANNFYSSSSAKPSSSSSSATNVSSKSSSSSAAARNPETSSSSAFVRSSSSYYSSSARPSSSSAVIGQFSSSSARISSSSARISSSSARTGAVQPPKVTISYVDGCADKAAGASIALTITPPTTGVIPAYYVYQKGEFITGFPGRWSWSRITERTTIAAPNSLTIGGLRLYWYFKYRVASVDASGKQTAWVESNQIRTSYPNPDPPINLTAVITGYTDTQAQITALWDRPALVSEGGSIGTNRNNVSSFVVTVFKYVNGQKQVVTSWSLLGTGKINYSMPFFVDLPDASAVDSVCYAIAVTTENGGNCISAARETSVCVDPRHSSSSAKMSSSSSAVSMPNYPGVPTLTRLDCENLMVTFETNNGNNPNIASYRLMYYYDTDTTIRKSSTITYAPGTQPTTHTTYLPLRPSGWQGINQAIGSATICYVAACLTNKAGIEICSPSWASIKIPAQAVDAPSIRYVDTGYAYTVTVGKIKAVGAIAVQYSFTVYPRATATGGGTILLPTSETATTLTYKGTATGYGDWTFEACATPNNGTGVLGCPTCDSRTLTRRHPPDPPPVPPPDPGGGGTGGGGGTTRYVFTGLCFNGIPICQTDLNNTSNYTSMAACQADNVNACPRMVVWWCDHSYGGVVSCANGDTPPAGKTTYRTLAECQAGGGC